MGRKTDSRGRNPSRWVRLEHSVIDSPAFQSLSPVAAKLFIMLLRVYNSHNNGEIGYSCRQASLVTGTSKDTAARAFKELESKGFIKATRKSGFNMKNRTSRRWALTCWPHPLGTAPTNDWRLWKGEKSESGTKAGTDGQAERTDEAVD